MPPKRPYDDKKIWEASSHLSKAWAREPNTIAMPALSYWHSANMDEIVREGRIKKNFRDYYWGALILTKSHLMWGGSNLNSYTVIGIPIHWIDMIGVSNVPRRAPIRFPPPDDYKVLTLKASKRPAPKVVVGFPGAQTPDRCSPVMDGSSVIWGFAVPPSPGDQLLNFLSRRLNEVNPDGWVDESDRYGRVLARTDVVEEAEEEEQAEQFRRRFEGYDDVQMPGEGVVFCGQCGVKNPSTSNFCAKCGERLVKL